MKKAAMWLKGHLLAGFYALALVLCVLSCLGTAIWDGIGYATGRLYPQELSLATAETQNVVVTDSGLWVSTTSDPQILLTSTQQIRTVRWVTQSDTVAGEIEGYYARNGGFSLRDRIFGRTTKTAGEAVLWFPISGGSTVRIDPVGRAGAVFAGGADEAVLYINEPRSFISYFVLDASQVFWLLVLPAIVAAIADWVKQMAGIIRIHKKQEGQK